MNVGNQEIVPINKYRIKRNSMMPNLELTRRGTVIIRDPNNINTVCEFAETFGQLSWTIKL